MVYQKETAMCVWRRTLPFASCIHAALTQKIDIFDTRAVIGYVERQHTICSLSYECKYTQNVVSRSSCVLCLDSKITDRISHTALTKRIDISYSRAIVR